MSFRKILTWHTHPSDRPRDVAVQAKEVETTVGIATEVGAVLKKVIPSVVKREELFITAKYWNSSHRPAEVEKELDETLKQLGLDYVDSYFVHWSVAFVPGKGLYPAHLARNIGVSNFTIAYIMGIIDATGVVPIVNQIEADALLPQ
ncbi:NADP-dependent oxidoreductase domain-containing protein [Mycena sanguinolenta]|nr:NADP-dependent oxidoreductase domain-containing protein [Mycena sanguinolenta]